MNYNLVGSLDSSVRTLWGSGMDYLPQIVAALLVVILGWILGRVLGNIVRTIFIKLKIDTALDKAGVDELSERAGYEFAPARFAGELVKWFIILAFTIVAFDILQLDSVTYFMREVVLGYLPKVFAAVLILFAGIIVAGLTRTAVVGMIKGSGGDNPMLFGKVAYFSVVFFTVLAVMSQLQIADELVETLFMGIVFALSLALGLSFGLGGKEAAAKYINKVTGGHHGHH